MRKAAFARVEALMAMQGYLTREDVRNGFEFEGKRIGLVNPQRGIWKPKEMRYVLSVKTSFTAPGKKSPYDDQIVVLEKREQFLGGNESIEYAFRGKDPESFDNQWLRVAHEEKVPIIYFLGIAPKEFLALWPIYIVDWDANRCKCLLSYEFKVSDGEERRKDMFRKIRVRLYQDRFREILLYAYDNKCAFSGFPEPQLLDAAHIIPYSEETLMPPTVQNGMLLSKIHHAAYDNNLIGVDPDYKIHVSNKLIEIHDGPFLGALKNLEGQKLRLPERESDYPDKERLEKRYEVFKQSA